VYFADTSNRFKAAGIKFIKSADCYRNISNLKIHLYRIYNNIMAYLEISTASMNATTSDISFVNVKTPIPMSATPLCTSETIPFYEPFPDFEPYESVSWSTVLS